MPTSARGLFRGPLGVAPLLAAAALAASAQPVGRAPATSRPPGAERTPASPATNRIARPPASSGAVGVPAGNTSPLPRAIPAAAPSPATNASARAPDLWYVAADRLNLRQGPGQQFPQVGELGRGATVNRVAETNDVKAGRWFRVRAGNPGPGTEGWVLSEHLARSRSLTEGDFSNLVYGPIPKRTYAHRPARRVRGLYVSLNVLGSRRFTEILSLARRTSINALVIDFKDDMGELLVESPTAARFNPAANSKVGRRELPTLIRQLKGEQLYLIARVVTFKDPLYAREHTDSAIFDPRSGRAYRSRDGLMWSSPYDADFRAYNLGLAEEAAAAGFDEVQFDYVRFPDVSREVRLNFRTRSTQTKAQVVQEFLLEARRRLEPRQVYLAADVFGLVCTTVDDMRIGQYWEAISNAVDFICPMMYPSHYANGSYGLDVPDRHPYEVLDRALRDARRRNLNLDTPAAIRPWLQGFTASWVKGHRKYGPSEVRTQIRALERHGIDSFLIWHPAGSYDAAAY